MNEILQIDSEWPVVDDLVSIRFDVSTWKNVWLRYVPPGEKFSKAIAEIAEKFRELGDSAQFAFVGVIPRGAEEFVEICGVTLVQADWVKPEYVVVIGNMVEKIIDEEYRVWKIK